MKITELIQRVADYCHNCEFFQGLKGQIDLIDYNDDYLTFDYIAPKKSTIVKLVYIVIARENGEIFLISKNNYRKIAKKYKL